MIDAYDALGFSASDVWLRDLVAQLDHGLIVIASREPLAWQRYDADWAGVIRELPLEGLPMQARVQLLTDGGVADPAERDVIARASVGVPFYLHLAVDSPGSERVVSQDRKNMILSTEHVVFLDWELALWGDPLYELAVHFHKMSYHDDEREAVLKGWLKVMAADCTRGWQKDLEIYLAHERVKSAIVRYTQLIWDGGLAREQEDHLIEKLTAQLNAAGTVWQWDQPRSMETVQRLIRFANRDH